MHFLKKLTELDKKAKLLLVTLALVIALGIVVPLVAQTETSVLFGYIHGKTLPWNITVASVLAFEHGALPCGQIDAVKNQTELDMVNIGVHGIRLYIAYTDIEPGVVGGFIPLLIYRLPVYDPETGEYRCIYDFALKLPLTPELKKILNITENVPFICVYWAGLIVYVQGTYAPLLAEASKVLQHVLEELAEVHPALRDLIYVEDGYVIITLGGYTVRIPLNISALPDCTRINVPDDGDICKVIPIVGKYPIWLPGVPPGTKSNETAGYHMVYKVFGVDHVLTEYIRLQPAEFETKLYLIPQPPITPQK